MSKGHGELRRSQLITTFGPGAMIDLPKKSIIIAGIDHWFESKESISENRLRSAATKILGRPITELKPPPLSDPEPGGTPRFVKGFVFPEWFVTREPLRVTPDRRQWRKMVLRQLLNKNLVWEDDGVKRAVTPVRFVSACRRGHVDEIGWRSFVHQHDDSCKRRELWMVERGVGGDLSEIEIHCVCGLQRNLIDAMVWKIKPLGTCNGRRPWLGAQSREDCDEPARLLQRTATNSYFPQVLSVISIPEDSSEEALAVEEIWELFELVESAEDLERECRRTKVQNRISGLSKERILTEILRRKNGSGSGPERGVKEVEIEILRDARLEAKEEEAKGDFFARAIDMSGMDSKTMFPIEKVILVHRLREVSAVLGFTRFESPTKDEVGEIDLSMDVKIASVALEKSWLPAIENRGEGIFLLFKKDVVNAWAGKPPVVSRAQELHHGQQLWWSHLGKEGEPPHYLSVQYALLHSLSHLLITTLSLECGYSASSIRERIYATDEGYGILLFTATPDAEGTLGGLVEQGRRIDRHLRSALESGRICSNDPVCSQHHFADHADFRPLNGSSCHGCLLISETCCEQQNHFLDRALVIPTLDAVDCAFYGTGNA